MRSFLERDNPRFLAWLDEEWACDWETRIDGRVMLLMLQAFEGGEEIGVAEGRQP